MTAPASGAASSRPASSSPPARCSRTPPGACGKRWPSPELQASAPRSVCIRPSDTRTGFISRPRSREARSSWSASPLRCPIARVARLGHAHADAPLVDLPLAAGPVGLAQLELLELAGRGAGERFTELDRGRALVVRHAAPAVGHQIAGAHLVPWTQHEQALGRLAPLP